MYYIFYIHDVIFQAFLTQDSQETIRKENEDLKLQISLMKLQLAEKDRRIEMLQRRLDQRHSHSLCRLTNIATQTDRRNDARKPRPVSWELTSVSLLKNL